MTATIINLSTHRTMRNRINLKINTEICADIARYTSLRPSPQETPTGFVERIVRLYLEGEAGK